jgi:hypothetical protein
MPSTGLRIFVLTIVEHGMLNNCRVLKVDKPEKIISGVGMLGKGTAREFE